MAVADIVQSTIDFVREHEAWAAPIVFGLAFGESLAFISLLIPAWSALIGIGALIGMSGIEFTPIWIGAALGAHPQIVFKADSALIAGLELQGPHFVVSNSWRADLTKILSGLTHDNRT